MWPLKLKRWRLRDHLAPIGRNTVVSEHSSLAARTIASERTIGRRRERQGEQSVLPSATTSTNLLRQLKHVEDVNGASADEKKQAKALSEQLGEPVEYAPWWVRILSAVCLGVGTMIGYQRIVTTLGQRLGKIHLTPAQGAAAETVSAVLIGISGFSGLPVSTTHIVTSGIAGTMVAARAGLQLPMLSRIAIAWLVTLPVTILIAGGLYYVLESPTAALGP